MNEAIRALQSYSIIEVVEEKDDVHEHRLLIHNLVQQVIRAELKENNLIHRTVKSVLLPPFASSNTWLPKTSGKYWCKHLFHIIQLGYVKDIGEFIDRKDILFLAFFTNSNLDGLYELLMKQESVTNDRESLYILHSLIGFILSEKNSK